MLASIDEAMVEAFFKSMNPASAPRPDGLLVSLFQIFWSTIKGGILALFLGFSRGTFDVSRLNYEIISLISKVSGASDIW